VKYVNPDRRHSAQSKEVQIQKPFPVVSPYPFRMLSNLNFYDEAIAASCIPAGGTGVDSVWYRRIAAVALLEYQYPSSVIRMVRAARSYAIPHVRMFFLSLRPLETVHVFPRSMLEPTNVWTGTAGKSGSVLIIGTKLGAVLEVFSIEEQSIELFTSRSIGRQIPESCLPCVRVLSVFPLFPGLQPLRRARRILLVIVTVCIATS
jgi:hypothetical protein